MIYIPDHFETEVRILLDLSDNPRHDVKTTTDHGRLAVVISDELHNRYLAYQGLSESSSPKEPKRSRSRS